MPVKSYEDDINEALWAWGEILAQAAADEYFGVKTDRELSTDITKDEVCVYCLGRQVGQQSLERVLEISIGKAEGRVKPWVMQ